LLKQERVKFDGNDCIDLIKFQWQPSRVRLQ
jgi:hypothetical protein